MSAKANHLEQTCLQCRHLMVAVCRNVQNVPAEMYIFILQLCAFYACKKQLKAIHAQENKEAAREKAVLVVQKLKDMKLPAAAKRVEDGIEETLTYMDFPTQHWPRIRTNNTIERVNRELKRRTRAFGAFPDGESALM